MQLSDIFVKPITRDIQGVIKVGQGGQDTIRQDLDEYVVTKELQRYFNDFFTAYLKSINGPTDKMGVWISGFFGSGKSHFLKILSYLLNSKVEIDGKTAIEFFKEQNKIADQTTIAAMDRAASIETDVLLFNIDSESKSGNKSDENAILNVFMQQFNKMQGFTDSNFMVADMERLLVEEGKYQDFKAAYKEINRNHDDWENGRNRYAFEKKVIEEALVKIDFGYDMPNFDVQKPISIKDFAEMVAKYIDKQGDNHHVVFLVDEVGQFIGDDVHRMLNLQTVVEELGVATKGKAWVIVTSQQSIDTVTKNLSGTDFSKIQGRFDTKIAMSSSNVDEVIKRRLLDKTNDAKAFLESDFANNANSIHNKLNFNGERKWAKYSSADDYAEIYPFVPYQFELLQTVLTAVREHGSDGKHLSEGERSMLAIFKEAAVRMKDASISSLVPFSMFFDGLENFLDHEHRIVITNAQKNERVNPDGGLDSFPIRVFETLFMIKYVDQFEKSLDNITTLMVSNTDEDVIELKKKVEAALIDLISQGFVEKTTQGYEFLTNQEQDIKKQIDKQNVTESEVATELGSLFFDDSTAIKETFNYPKLRGNYVFKFNELIDDVPIKSNRNDLTIKVITPQSEDNRNEVTLSVKSAQNTLMIDMPVETNYLDEVRQAL
ncbi:BREX system P-loop protein BrxC [Periweissella fabalis]|uniref:BREX system P-loop protein BrxC n=1 Tax=Periweissella fabalis TaxID=1070421 RepID=UPI001FEC3222|nr:BREX system P-loop protein BrxC [Periweissella fabalis]